MLLHHTHHLDTTTVYYALRFAFLLQYLENDENDTQNSSRRNRLGWAQAPEAEGQRVEARARAEAKQAQAQGF